MVTLQKPIEAQARYAMQKLAEIDPARVDLDTLLSIGLLIRAMTTKACAAQMKVGPDDDPVF